MNIFSWLLFGLKFGFRAYKNQDKIFALKPQVEVLMRNIEFALEDGTLSSNEQKTLGQLVNNVWVDTKELLIEMKILEEDNK